MLGKTLESPLESKEIKPVHPKGYQPLIFIGKTDAKAEAPILWSPHVKSWLIGKDPDAGKDWEQQEKGAAEDETVRWHQQLNWHEFEQTLGYNEGQGSLVCCSPWGRKESDMTYWLKNYNKVMNGINQDVSDISLIWVMFGAWVSSFIRLISVTSQQVFIKQFL